jgi:hypothetical protein
VSTLTVHLPKCYLIQESDYPLVTILNQSPSVVGINRVLLMNNNDYQIQSSANLRWTLTVNRYTSAAFAGGPKFIPDVAVTPTTQIFIAHMAEVTGTASTLRRYIWGWDEVAAGNPWDWGGFARQPWATLYDGRDRQGATQPWRLNTNEALVIRAGDANAATDRAFPVDVGLELSV